MSATKKSQKIRWHCISVWSTIFTEKVKSFKFQSFHESFILKSASTLLVKFIYEVWHRLSKVIEWQ